MINEKIIHRYDVRKNTRPLQGDNTKKDCHSKGILYIFILIKKSTAIPD